MKPLPGPQQSDRPPGARAGLWVIAQSLLLGAAIAVPVIQVLVRHTSDWPDPLVWPARIVGLVLLAISVLIFRAAASALGPDLVATPRPVEGSHLRDQGVYGRVRHPVYVALVLGVAGWCLLWNSTVGLILAACCVGFFILKARYEEALLQHQFPDYTEYRQRVPAFVPRSARPEPNRDPGDR